MRPSVVISYGRNPRTRVLVDTTPELRLQCIANKVDRIDAVVYTHAHADHIMGLDDVRRFNAIKGGPLDVWGEKKTLDSISGCFGYAFQAPDPAITLFRPHLERRLIDGGGFSIGGQLWAPIRVFHGSMPILGFRVGNLAYCTDVSRIPEESLPLLEGLDVLVLGALQYKKHTTHFTVEEAIEVAQRVRPRRTLFTHIAHALGHAQTNRKLPPGIRLAYDGQRVTASLAAAEVGRGRGHNAAPETPLPAAAG